MSVIRQFSGLVATAVGVVVSTWILVSMSGCETAHPSPPAGGDPPSSPVGVGEAWRDAEQVAQSGAGRHAVTGAGASMQPIYGDNTLMVLGPVDFEDLEPGMMIAYVNQHGRRVVHQLVAKTRQGWTVIGLNNERIDDDLVTRQNLIGMVYATFSHDEE